MTTFRYVLDQEFRSNSWDVVNHALRFMPDEKAVRLKKANRFASVVNTAQFLAENPSLAQYLVLPCAPGIDTSLYRAVTYREFVLAVLAVYGQMISEELYASLTDGTVEDYLRVLKIRHIAFQQLLHNLEESGLAEQPMPKDGPGIVLQIYGSYAVAALGYR